MQPLLTSIQLALIKGHGLNALACFATVCDNVYLLCRLRQHGSQHTMDRGATAVVQTVLTIASDRSTSPGLDWWFQIVGMSNVFSRKTRCCPAPVWMKSTSACTGIWDLVTISWTINSRNVPVHQNKFSNFTIWVVFWVIQPLRACQEHKKF